MLQSASATICQGRLRQYSISNSDDDNNISNDRCPEYALSWDYMSNKPHWPLGHDYFLGNGKNVTDNIELRQILSEKMMRGTLSKKIIFCDLDGVLADFEQGVINKFHKSPDEMNSGLLWGLINKSDDFFETLPWMPRGRELWEAIKEYDPIILTGIPRSKKAAEQKRKWCARELGLNVHVITCSTKEKTRFCIKDALLIDDRTDNLKVWNEKGGHFIHYNETLTDTVIERINEYMK